MDINAIIPYKNNARHIEKAIPAVAESIRKFGFKGAIVLESRDNPVIVNGHTRVAACKSLGWKDFPDENIVFADDLTADEIKAFRLADNKTGEIATWNTALLKKEMKAIAPKLDMSKVGFKMPNKKKPYGAERFRTDDYYNLGLVNRFDCVGKFNMPPILGTNHIPDHLLGFNYAKSSNDTEATLHFFIDDYQFERLWNNPQKYIPLLKKFDAVLSPDFSLYIDMPLPVQIYNEYRRRALAYFWQINGIEVIPTISFSTPETYDFCFDGLPKHSVIASSTVGVCQYKESRQMFIDGMTEAIVRLEPTDIIMYVSDDLGIDYKGANVHRFRNPVTDRMTNNG